MSESDCMNIFDKVNFPEPIKGILQNCKSLTVPQSREEVFSMAVGHIKSGTFEVSYDVNGKEVVEATVTKVKNGLCINYPEAYMRRRDPNCMFIADKQQTDKVKYEDHFKKPFEPIRERTFDWLKSQDLAIMMFRLNSPEEDSNKGAMLVAPSNAGFFVGGLGDLQGMIPPSELPDNFDIHSVIYLAPPFRHTDFDGKQVVVHNRLDGMHEIFSYNLYPGPSAKKGVYGILLTLGETEDWPTLHASTVQVETPYDNITTIMHEGASGGGKSEMLEYVHRQEDGRLCLGRNTLDGDTKTLLMSQTCQLYPVTDDMATCMPISHNKDGYLKVKDAEQAWFLRVNHIDHYGTDPHLESVTAHPKAPLLFLNIDGSADATALIWEHIMDSPGKACPNPRVILPRHLAPGSVEGLVEVMVRSFGVRTPPCTKEHPTYGIFGYMHLLPPALAWLWRLVAPRGHGNPSITDSEGLTSEGVGSYWPFATGRIVDHANLLLRQIQSAEKIKYVLIPNQHVGAWETSFMPQWISREYLARRGVAPFRSKQIKEARCSLLGYALNSMQVEGTQIPEWLLQVDLQKEVGPEGYDAGAEILQGFFDRELKKFLHEDLDKTGKDIITCCLDRGSVSDYENLLAGI